ncbi:MAG: hypothetical protein AAGF84_00565 [Planctomycetota bacterium]
MLLTILVVLTVYLLACYAYGAALLIRRGMLLRKERHERGEAIVDPTGIVTHRYPESDGVAQPMATKAAA